MNVTKSLAPLPQALNERRAGPNRRRRIGDHQIDPEALRHFNELLERIDLRHPPLDPDQVASAARELAASSRSSRWPRSILQRMRRAAAIDRMLSDPEWTLDDAEAAAVVVAYLHEDRPLIPNSVPMVGRLDDAIIVEASWPLIAQEVRDYLDFCRLRRIEATLRGERRRYFGFSRQAWQSAARAEAALVDHVHRVDGSSYLPADAGPRFQVR